MALSLQHYTRSIGTGLNRFLKERVVKEREGSTILAINIGEALPENVIVEILSWLPVKELLQFKSVCKSWCEIISSPNFVSKHLKNYYKLKKNDDDCILVQYYVAHTELQLFELLVDDTPRVLACEVLYDVPMYGSFVCGPCDGIYYLYDYDDEERAFWNPVLDDDLKKLPPIITKPNLSSNLTYAKIDAYGFGSDPAMDDYKVVVLKGYRNILDEEDGESHPQSVLVYSLRTDCWRYLGDLSHEYELVDNKCYMFLNGCYYWLGSCGKKGNPEWIISFDMGTDAIQEIQVPDYNQPACNNIVAIHDDSLAFLAVHGEEQRVDVWTWNEGLWTKKFTMGPFSDVPRPIGHWNDKIILEFGFSSELSLCDPKTQELNDLAFQRSTWCEGVFVYRESLFSVKDKNNEES